MSQAVQIDSSSSSRTTGTSGIIQRKNGVLSTTTKDGREGSNSEGGGGGGGGEESSENNPAADVVIIADDPEDTKHTNHHNNEAEEEKKEDKVATVVVQSAEEKAALKKKYENWPLKNISEPHDHDVLYGRGGGTNHHPGNKRYRKMVEDKKLDYVNSKRLDKPLVALEIIKAWRGQEPPGRFLKLDEKTGLWFDVGDKKAREKTSQALREKAPLIRKQLDEEKMGGHEGSDGETKTTRFAEGTKDGSSSGGSKVKKPGLARDTSLGPLAAENVTLDGFSWQEGIGETSSQAIAMEEMTPSPKSVEPSTPPSVAPLTPVVHHHHHHPPPPPYPPQPPPPPHPGAPSYPIHSGGLPPPEYGHYRYGSHGSIASSMGPPPTAYVVDDRRMPFTASGRFDSWGSLPPPPSSPRLQSTGSWGAPEHGMASQREHSLGQFPLPHASIVHPAPYATFDTRAGSGHYGPYPPPPHAAYGPPPPVYHYPSSSGAPPPHAVYRGPTPPNVGYGGNNNNNSSSSGGGSNNNKNKNSNHLRSPTSSHSIDPAVASAWSGQPQAEIVKTLSDDDYEAETKNSRKSTSTSPKSSSSSLGLLNTSSKPEMIKRATSNQNETVETKPDRVGVSVKRAALNRDSSRASNRLKEICFPGQFTNGTFDATKEVNELSEDMHRHRLGETTASTPRPWTISEHDRISTFDCLPPLGDEEQEDAVARARETWDGNGNGDSGSDLYAMDLAVRPKALSTSSRSSTIEGLALDTGGTGIGDDVLLKPEPAERTTTMDLVMADLERPGSIRMDSRLSTSDFLQIVNEPLADDDPSLFSGKRQAV